MGPASRPAVVQSPLTRVRIFANATFRSQDRHIALGDRSAEAVGVHGGSDAVADRVVPVDDLLVLTSRGGIDEAGTVSAMVVKPMWLPPIVMFTAQVLESNAA